MALSSSLRSIGGSSRLLKLHKLLTDGSVDEGQHALCIGDLLLQFVDFLQHHCVDVSECGESLCTLLRDGLLCFLLAQDSNLVAEVEFFSAECRKLYLSDLPLKLDAFQGLLKAGQLELQTLESVDVD